MSPVNVFATLLNICCRFYVPLHACCPFKGPSWWVHNCIMCVVSGMRYGRIYLACLCIYSDVPVSLSGSTAWLWIRVFCHKSCVQDRAYQLFYAAAFLYISVWMQWFMFYLLLDQTSYGPSFWNIYSKYPMDKGLRESLILTRILILEAFVHWNPPSIPFASRIGQSLCPILASVD